MLLEYMLGDTKKDSVKWAACGLLLLCLAFMLAGQPVLAARESEFCHEETLSDLAPYFVPPPRYLRRTSQGMCAAGRFIVYTRYNRDDEATSYVLINKETGTVAGHYDFHTKHSNSLTYNPRTGHLVSVSKCHAYIFALEGNQMRLVEDRVMPRNFCKIAYVARRNGYYLGTSTGIYFSQDLKEFSKVFDVPKVAVNQGMACDGKYIYINWYRYQHNLIYKYTLGGKYVGRYSLDSDFYREVEEVDFDSGNMFINVINSPANGIYLVRSSHVMKPWQTEKESACGEEGLEASVCSLCGTKITRAIPADGQHEVSDWLLVKEATCKKEGVIARICLKCHKVLAKQLVPRTAHCFGKWKIVKKSGTDSRRIAKRVCKVCHKKETRKLSDSGK